MKDFSTLWDFLVFDVGFSSPLLPTLVAPLQPHCQELNVVVSQKIFADYAQSTPFGSCLASSPNDTNIFFRSETFLIFFFVPRLMLFSCCIGKFNYNEI